jgi:hypothetical protein
MKRSITIVALLALLALSAAASRDTTADAARAIWAVTDGEKIERDDVNSPLKSRNAGWDGKRVRLFGARNEVIAFQLIVEAGSSGIKQLSAALPELALKDGKAKDCLSLPWKRSVAIRQPTHTTLLCQLPQRNAADRRELVLQIGSGATTGLHWLEARTTRTRKCEAGPRRVPARCGAASQSSDMGRNLHCARPGGWDLFGQGHRKCRRQANGHTGRA